jgi:hypothetical protein
MNNGGPYRSVIAVESGRKPVLIDPRILRPLDKSMWGFSCSRCDKRQSKWEVMHDGEQIILCSVCFLYDTPWGQKNAVGIEELIADTERESKQKFPRTEDGRLTIDRADQIMAAIALTSRMFAMQDRIKTMKTEN